MCSSELKKCILAHGNQERSGFMRVFELGARTISGTYILCSSNEIGDATSWEKSSTGGDREYHVNNLILHLIISTYINYIVQGSKL